MAFWGIEIKPGRPHTHSFDEKQGRLHLSQATLGGGSSAKKTIVQCAVGEKRPVHLCSLFPERIENCPLNLEFEEREEVTFSVIGHQSVHLSGFFIRDAHVVDRDNYDDIYEEDIAETETDDESTDYDTEDEYEDGFSNDDMFPTSRIPNSGVVIEEILDDEKPATVNRSKKKNQSSESDGNGNSQEKIIVKNGSSVPILGSEGEDGFPTSSPCKSKADALNSKEEAGEIKETRSDEKTQRMRVEDNLGQVKSLERKIDAVVWGDDQARETGQSLATNDVKQNKKQKKRKKKQARGKAEESHQAGTDGRSSSHFSGVTAKEMDQPPPIGEGSGEKQQTGEKSANIDTDSTGEGAHSKRRKKRRISNRSTKQESGMN